MYHHTWLLLCLSCFKNSELLIFPFIVFYLYPFCNGFPPSGTIFLMNCDTLRNIFVPISET
jgi:hypothetical protein